MAPQSLPDDTFLYFSELLGQPVLGASGEQLGTVADLVASSSGAPYPLVDALRVRTRARQLKELPWSEVDGLEDRRIRVRGGEEALGEPKSGGIALAADVLDRQVVDTDGAKVKRVNDIHLLWTRRELRIVHADVGLRGLIRRMGWQAAVDRLLTTLAPRLPYLKREELVSWKHVQPVGGEVGKIRLGIRRASLAELHPADLVEILEDLNRPEREMLFRELPVETAADALEEATPDLQRELVESMERERAADVIEAMEPDDAADLLGVLPSEDSAELLSAMEPAEARDVKQLLAYERDSAGGMMTSDFLKVAPERTVEEVIEDIRQRDKTFKPVHDVFLLSPEGKLRGTVSLVELLLADRRQQLQALAHEPPATLNPDDAPSRAAELVAKYRVLSLPVQDQEGRVLGVVTVDDVLERAVGD